MLRVALPLLLAATPAFALDVLEEARAKARAQEGGVVLTCELVRSCLDTICTDVSEQAEIIMIVETSVDVDYPRASGLWIGPDGALDFTAVVNPSNEAIAWMAGEGNALRMISFAAAGGALAMSRLGVEPVSATMSVGTCEVAE